MSILNLKPRIIRHNNSESRNMKLHSVFPKSSGLQTFISLSWLEILIKNKPSDSLSSLSLTRKECVEFLTRSVQLPCPVTLPFSIKIMFSDSSRNLIRCVIRIRVLPAKKPLMQLLKIFFETLESTAASGSSNK